MNAPSKLPLLAVDPGLRAVGWVLWSQAGFSAGLVRSEEKDRALVVRDIVKKLWAAVGEELWRNRAPMALVPARVVIEQMRVYPGPQQKGDPNDLVDVAHVAGGIVGVYALTTAEVQLVPAREWKGQVPKPIMQKRIERSLTEIERKIAHVAMQNIPPSLRHNVWDAIGIGLDAEGRLR